MTVDVIAVIHYSVVVVLGGGNIDITMLGRSLERGLAADGRLVQFSVRLMDRPGTLSDLTLLLKRDKASINGITQESTWLDKTKSINYIEVRHIQIQTHLLIHVHTGNNHNGN